MAPKKSTEQSTATVVATPAANVSAPVEKTKKSKKTEVAATPVAPVSTPSASVPVANPTATADVVEKPKKTKKSAKEAVPAADVPVVSSPVVSSPVEEAKPKKVSKKKSQETVQQGEQSEEVSAKPDGSVTKEKKKRASKKSDATAESSETVSEQSETSEPSESVPAEKRARKVVSQETLKADVEQLKQQVEAEILRLRTDQQKNKGVKFLKAVNKSLKTLTGDLNRVLKTKTKTVRNKNTSSGFMKPVKISSEMASFTQWDPSQLYSRVDVTKYLCSYIKNNSLQNPEDRRQILCDEKLSTLLRLDSDNSALTYPGLQQHIQQHFINDNSAVSEEVVQP
jgi:upstream activation factor subunit UAF30